MQKKGSDDDNLQVNRLIDMCFEGMGYMALKEGFKGAFLKKVDETKQEEGSGLV